MHIQQHIKAWLFAGFIGALAGGAAAQSGDGVAAQAQAGAESAQSPTAHREAETAKTQG